MNQTCRVDTGLEMESTNLELLADVAASVGVRRVRAC